MRTSLAMLALTGLFLAGCGENAAKPEATSTTPKGGLMREVQRETQSSQVTKQGLKMALYFDISESSHAIRKDISNLMTAAVDTYPDVVPVDYADYGNNCYAQGKTVSTLIGLRKAGKEWQASKLGDHGTNLSTVFKDLHKKCDDEPETSVAGVIATDGGFEDDEAAVAACKSLAECKNLRYLAFVGLQSADTNKYQKLTDLTHDLQKGGTGIHLVTLGKSNDTMIDEARSDLQRLTKAATAVK